MSAEQPKPMPGDDDLDWQSDEPSGPGMCLSSAWNGDLLAFARAQGYRTTDTLATKELWVAEKQVKVTGVRTYTGEDVNAIGIVITRNAIARTATVPSFGIRVQMYVNGHFVSSAWSWTLHTEQAVRVREEPWHLLVQVPFIVSKAIAATTNWSAENFPDQPTTGNAGTLENFLYTMLSDYARRLY